MTSLSGELFAVLSEHSILARGCESLDDEASFIDGVEQAQTHSDIDLLYLLFQTRSRQLQLPSLASPHRFLSGLIIGRDVATSQKLFNREPNQPITFIGQPQLTKWYQLAANQLSLNTEVMDGSQISKTGLHFIYQSLNIN